MAMSLPYSRDFQAALSELTHSHLSSSKYPAGVIPYFADLSIAVATSHISRPRHGGPCFSCSNPRRNPKPRYRV